MHGQGEAVALDAALLAREGWIDRSSRRWSGLAHASALAFVAMLYSNPMYWWPWFEKARLGYLTAAACGLAVVVHRVVSGERMRVGGWPSLLVLVYLALIPLSLAWTLDARATLAQSVEAWKMAVIYIAVQNSVATPSRLRRFMLAAALASLGPALGSIHVWWTNDALIEGYRTHWHAFYGDPNRLAMSLVAVMPFAMYGVYAARRRWVRLLFLGVTGAQIVSIILTHSRSGAIAAGVAAFLFLFRGKGGIARGAFAAAALAVCIGAFAPETFWRRSSTLAHLDEDASVQGRENAWKVLRVVVAERPLSGVGAGAFLAAWPRYAPLDAGGHRYVAHNLLFEVVADVGIPAFLLFAAFTAFMLWRTWTTGRDPLVGAEARAIFAALAGYLVCEMVNGYSMSWFLYFLFACGAAAARMARVRAALAAEASA
ncbi:MAG TPA: O-antigen ligase family protein [Anaeromyxobacter sp.]